VSKRSAASENVRKCLFIHRRERHRTTFRGQIWWKSAVVKLPYHTKKLALRGTRPIPHFSQNGPIEPKIAWTLSPFNMSTYTEFGPDRLHIAGLILERLIFRPKKSIQYRLSAYKIDSGKLALRSNHSRRRIEVKLWPPVCSSVYQVLLKSVQWFCRWGWSKIAISHYFGHRLHMYNSLYYRTSRQHSLDGSSDSANGDLQFLQPPPPQNRHHLTCNVFSAGSTLRGALCQHEMGGPSYPPSVSLPLPPSLSSSFSLPHLRRRPLKYR